MDLGGREGYPEKVRELAWKVGRRTKGSREKEQGMQRIRGEGACVRNSKQERRGAWDDGARAC